jgi:hypothetical protein
MKSQLTSKNFLKLFVFLLFFVVLNGCQKTDILPDSSSPEAKSLSSNYLKSALQTTQENADFVYEWYRAMAEIQLPNPAGAPPINYRNFAYIGIGLFESVQPGIKGGSSLSPKLYQMPAMPKPDMSKDYLWSASANAALASMFKLFLTGNTGLTPANIASVDAMEAANYNSFRSMASEDVLQRSEAFGRAVATAIFNWSATDNFTMSSVGWVPPVFPGSWVPTSNPPTITGAYLGDSRPLLKYSLTALAPPLPFPYSTDPSSQFYQAAKEVYDIGVSQNAALQATARWWADAGGPGVGYPAPYHLISIVTNVLEQHNAGLWKAAEVYAKTGIGIKDGPIITFRSKYHYNLLRPITYIRQNIDANWNSLLASPAYPEYPSGLISNIGPVIQVLIREFGDIPVTDDLYSWRGLPVRQYSSLSQLLREAADSRIYAGIHYRFAQDVSVEMGIQLGNEIAKIRIVGPEY